MSAELLFNITPRETRVALSENGGGVIGFDEAAASVTILERAN